MLFQLAPYVPILRWKPSKPVVIACTAVTLIAATPVLAHANMWDTVREWVFEFFSGFLR